MNRSGSGQPCGHLIAELRNMRVERIAPTSVKIGGQCLVSVPARDNLVTRPALQCPFMSKRAREEVEAEARAVAQAQFIWWGELMPELQAKIVRRMVTHAGEGAVGAFSQTSREWHQAVRQTLAKEFNALLDRHCEEATRGYIGEPLKRNYLQEVADFIRGSGVSADYLYRNVMKGNRSIELDDDNYQDFVNNWESIYPNLPVPGRPVTAWDEDVLFAPPKQRNDTTVEEDIIRLEFYLAGGPDGYSGSMQQRDFASEGDRARANAFLLRMDRKTLAKYMGCTIPDHAVEVICDLSRFYCRELSMDYLYYLPHAVINALMKVGTTINLTNVFVRRAFPDVQSVARCHLAYGADSLSDRTTWEGILEDMGIETNWDGRIFLTFLPPFQELLAGPKELLLQKIDAWFFLVGKVLTMDERAGVSRTLRKYLVETHDLSLLRRLLKTIGSLFPLDEVVPLVQSLPLSLVDACPSILGGLLARGENAGLESFNIAVWRWRSTADGTESEALFDLQRNNQRLLTYLLWEDAASERGPEIVAEAATITPGPFPPLPSAPLDRVMHSVAKDKPAIMVNRLFFYLHHASEYDFGRVITHLDMCADYSHTRATIRAAMVHLFQRLAEAGHAAALAALLPELRTFKFKLEVQAGLEQAASRVS